MLGFLVFRFLYFHSFIYEYMMEYLNITLRSELRKNQAKLVSSLAR